MRLSLRWKILFYTSALLILLLGVNFLVTNYQAQSFVNEQITLNLNQARQRAEIKQTERVTSLRLIAQSVATFPELKALMLTTDQATVQNFLDEDMLRRFERLNLLIVLDVNGRVLASNVKGAVDPVPDAQSKWLKPAVENQAAIGRLSWRGEAFDAVLVPASASGTVFGFVLTGSRIDDALAQELRTSGREEVVLASDHVLGSTVEQTRLPWQKRADWEFAVQAAGRHQTVSMNGESYLALPFLIGVQDPPLLAVILQSRDSALAPYRRIQLGIIVAGLTMLLVGVILSTFLSRSVSTGVSRLESATERVARGDFRTTIEVEKSDATEISNLANSFNEMIRGLRERADMQKFISQSTVDMIRGRGAGKLAAGERVDMTLFFSDIRGFTVLSEQRPPEEVVRLLNDCLSLQAGVVQKYEGDIDKFMGDCVMAHFYGPEGTLKAAQCAMEIEKALQKVNERLAASERIEVGIGIARGEAILGSIGSENRRDFTAVGSTVNLCSRLCSLASAGEILLSEDAFRAIEQDVPAEKLEPVNVKGFSRPIPVYRIAVKARATV